MDHVSQPKSQLASLALARELLCLNRPGSMLNITSQWRDREILIFRYKSIYEKLDHMNAEAPMSMFGSYLSVRLRDNTEKTGLCKAETDSRSEHDHI